jgi:hypothetical protein
MLSKQALEALEQMFSEKSNLQVSVGLINVVVEIRQWIEEEQKKLKVENK